MKKLKDLLAQEYVKSSSTWEYTPGELDVVEAYKAGWDESTEYFLENIDSIIEMGQKMNELSGISMNVWLKGMLEQQKDV